MSARSATLSVNLRAVNFAPNRSAVAIAEAGETGGWEGEMRMYMAVAGSLYVRGCIDACICLSLPASLSFLASLSRFLSDTRLYVYIYIHVTS
jgi:hypothetical protein